MKTDQSARQDNMIVPTFLSTNGALGPDEDAVRTAPAIVDYWRLMTREKYKILVPALLVAIGVVAVSLALPPMYRASATVLFDAEQRRPVSFEDVYRGLSSDQGAHVTQAEFLQTRDVALRVIRKLDLSSLGEFNPSPPGWLARTRLVTYLTESLAKLTARGTDAAGTSPPIPMDHVLATFRDNLKVDRLGQTQLFKVEFESREPQVAADVANEVVAAYIRADMDARYEATKEANSWLSDRLASLERSLDRSERALQDYRQKNGLLARGADAATDRQMSELSQRLIDARIKRTALEEAVSQAGNRDISLALTAPSIASNASVIRARAAEVAAEKRLTELGNQLGTAHPQYQSASSELTAARTNLRQEIAGAVRTLGRELAAAQAAEQQVQSALESARAAGQSLDNKGMELNQLEREVAINRQLYETFLARNKEITAASDFQQPAARLIDPALPPQSSSRLPLALVAALGAVAGALVGLLAVLVSDRLRNTLRTTEDVESRLGEAMLAAVPKLTSAKGARAAMLVIDEPESLFSEAIRTVATGVTLASLNGMNSVIAISSALEGEGKTTIACNLALALSSTRRVCLIDADLHKPSVAGSFKLDPGAKGLAQLLDGRARIEECLQQVSGSQLNVIAAGRIPGNPLDLLMGERLRSLVVALQGRFDLIILDTPPIQLVSDTMLLGRVASSMLMVAYSDRTPVPAIRRAFRKIHAMRIQILGVVLNAHDFKRADRYYGENSGYGAENYRYGYGRSRKSA